MKKISITFGIVVLAIGLTGGARASDGYGDDQYQYHRGFGWYHQYYQEEVPLVPSMNAPTNAAGRVSLRLDDDNGTNGVAVTVRVAGLPVAAYNVSVTDATGTNSWDLGSFDVTQYVWHHREGSWEDLCEDEDDNECTNDPDFSANAPTITTNIVDFGRAEFDLPPDLDPTNVAYVYVFDTNGIVDMTGDLTTSTNLTGVFYCRTVSVTPGNDTNAEGSATVKFCYKKGKTITSFSLNVAGLPVKETVSIGANGVAKLKTSTSNKGAVAVETLPHTDLGDLQDVDGLDTKGRILFDAKF